MKNLLWLLTLISLVLNTAAFGKAQPNADVTLDSAEAIFETTTNDKDHDSLVTITVKHGNTVIAAANNIGGHWNDHSDHNVALNIGKGWTRDELKSRLKTELSFSTNGNDKWEFNYILRLNWSDGTSTEVRYNGQVLTQDDRFRSYAVGL
ncbi:MAG: hypothetical protein JST84_10825 [Acidobacteria bacterium]|nr:hypothetical protein [Acidobacteriota bacterium]